MRPHGHSVGCVLCWLTLAQLAGGYCLGAPPSASHLPTPPCWPIPCHAAHPLAHCLPFSTSSLPDSSPPLLLLLPYLPGLAWLQVLTDREMRREVVPGLPLHRICQLLERFEPDDCAPDPLPPGVHVCMQRWSAQGCTRPCQMGLLPLNSRMICTACSSTLRVLFRACAVQGAGGSG